MSARRTSEEASGMAMIVGHRGARNLWPENSLGGFRRLLALGVEAVEFDVHETRDRQFVVLHDPTLDRTTEATGAVRELDAATVLASRLRPVPGGPPADSLARDGAGANQGGQRTDRDDGANDGDERVPSLDAVLDLLAPSALELHIEIKTDALGEVATDGIERLVGVVHRHRLEARSILTCFVPDVLERVRAIWPDAPVLASLDHRSAEMLGGLSKALARYAAMPGCIVAVQKELLGRSWTQCHDALGAARLGVWVPNERAEIERWLRMPLRQLTTDRPDLALAARRALQA